jgi:hypothetical protein
VRQALGSYVASNQAWQNASAAERQYLLSKVNARFERVYTKNGWPYEPIETISDSNR